MHSLLKVPLILANTVALHVAHTPPNPPASKTERPAGSAPNNRYLAFASQFIGLMKVLSWVAAVSETSIILAHHIPEFSPLLANIPATLLTQNTQNHLTLSSLIGTLFILSGTFMRWQSYRALEKFFTWEVSVQKNHQLVTTGPYGVVRHPSYTGFLLVYGGMILWFGACDSWLRASGFLHTALGAAIVYLLTVMWGVAMVGLVSRVPQEDKILRDLFTKEWDDWARRVPYCLIPGIY